MQKPEPERVKEQIAEMAARAQARVEVTEAHHRQASERRHQAELETVKFRFLSEGIAAAEQQLAQRRKQLENSEEAAAADSLKGLDAAVEMLRDLHRQIRENNARNEGRAQTHREYEEEFRKEITTAVSRFRGLEVHGARAVELAERQSMAARGEITKLDPTSSNSEAPNVDFAKDPIEPPKRKTEH